MQTTTAYHRPDDLFVTVRAVDGYEAIVDHPQRGRCVVLTTDLEILSDLRLGVLQRPILAGDARHPYLAIPETDLRADR
jgi:hypothetical protein